MKTRARNSLICAMIFIAATSSFGCSSKSGGSEKVVIEADRKVIETTYSYVDCGDLKLSGIGIQKENPNLHAGSYENQQIMTRNLILMDYKLREAETILNCYKRQVKKEEKK